MISKPRILFILPLPPPLHGSSVVSRHIMESGLVREHFDCDYVNMSTSRSIEEIGKWNIRKLFRAGESFFSVLWKLLTKPYDVCYLAMTCHGHGFLKDAPFALICKMAGCGIVIHQHNKGMTQDVDRWPYNKLMPLVYRGSKVILLSERLYPDIAGTVGKEQVLLCPNGIEDTPVRQKKTGDLPHILFLSNLIESKGIFDLIEACSILRRKGVRFICDVVGAESSEISTRSLEENIRLKGLENLVIYHGRQYGEDKERFWAECEVMVFPTYNDVFSLVILEAMQHSTAVITTDEGGIPDMVDDGVNGFITEKRCPEKLAEKMEILLSDRELASAMGREGRRIYEERYTLDAFDRHFISCLYEALVSLKHKR